MSISEDELTPLNISVEVVNGFAQPVGFIILNWAMIEQALVTQIEAVGHLSSGAKEKRQGAFGDRVRLMKRLYEKVPELAEYKAPGLEMLAIAEKLQPLRDAFAHGALQAYLSDKKLLIFNRVKPTEAKDGHDIHQVSISVDDLQKAIDTIAQTRRSMVILGNTLMRKFGIQL